MTRYLTAVASITALLATPAAALNTGEYRSLVAETVVAINAGDVDVDHLIGIQEQLISIGVAGLREYGTNHPEDSKLTNFVVHSVPLMKEMTLDEIEDAWHEGNALSEIGIDIHSLDHFGAAISHMDSVIHPATAIIALREYASSGSEDYLDQVVDELSEVVEHISIIQ